LKNNLSGKIVLIGLYQYEKQATALKAKTFFLKKKILTSLGKFHTAYGEWK